VSYEKIFTLTNRIRDLEKRIADRDERLVELVAQRVVALIDERAEAKRVEAARSHAKCWRCHGTLADHDPCCGEAR